MDRKPRGEASRSHSGVRDPTLVTHRTHALARSATLPEQSTHAALPSASPPLYTTGLSVATTRGARHSPAVWLFEDFVPARDGPVGASAAGADGEDDEEGEEKQEEDDTLAARTQERAAHRPRHLHHNHRHHVSPDLSRPWMVDAIDLQYDAAAEAPSPRVLDHRLLPRRGGSASTQSRPSLSYPSIEEIAATSIPSHADFVSAPPEDVTEDRRSASLSSHASSVSVPQTDTQTRTWASATAVREERTRAGKQQHQHHRQSRPPPQPQQLQQPQQHPSPRISPSPSTASNASSSSSSSSPPSARSMRIDRPRPPPPPPAPAPAPQRKEDHKALWLSTASTRNHSAHRHRHRHHRRSPPSRSPSSASSAETFTTTSSPTALPDHEPHWSKQPRAHSAKTSSALLALEAQHPSSSPAEGGHGGSCSTCVVDGFGPLMVVRLDALPALPYDSQHGAAATSAPAASPASLTEVRDTAALMATSKDGGQQPLAHSLRNGGGGGDRPASPPASTAAALQALLRHEAAEAHTNEVAALHARLEVAEQRARVAEQQVTAAAEVRAAALVEDYKAEERRRRTQFQSTLDTLREENRDLTARLEAAARAPAVGLQPSASAAAAAGAATTGMAATTAAPSTPSAPTTFTRVDGALVSASAAAAGVAAAAIGTASSTEIEVARQVHAVEAYWRDRLRTAERHWEEEMTRQSQQRREALDQVEELVRTVEQSQEELRYTRRQAARLREENVRLSSAATSAAASRVMPSSAVASMGAEEVERMRRTVKAHEHREAALLAQVESYAEEATQVRLRCEAAVERARQDVAAERRRSTELVKLYGSQIESLHHQLREAREGRAPSR